MGDLPSCIGLPVSALQNIIRSLLSVLIKTKSDQWAEQSKVPGNFRHYFSYQHHITSHIQEFSWLKEDIKTLFIGMTIVSMASFKSKISIKRYETQRSAGLWDSALVSFIQTAFYRYEGADCSTSPAHHTVAVLTGADGVPVAARLSTVFLLKFLLSPDPDLWASSQCICWTGQVWAGLDTGGCLTKPGTTTYHSQIYPAFTWEQVKIWTGEKCVMDNVGINTASI